MNSFVIYLFHYDFFVCKIITNFKDMMKLFYKLILKKKSVRLVYDLHQPIIVVDTMTLSINYNN